MIKVLEERSMAGRVTVIGHELTPFSREALQSGAVDVIITHKDNAQFRGRQLVEKMRELIPRQMFDIAIQAAIGNHVIARSTVKAMRKDVLAKCYSYNFV